MAAAIISFPTLFERDEAEFVRKSTSNYVRAIEEAASLWSAVATPLAPDRVGLSRRIATFSRKIEHLARYRPECLGDTVALAGGCYIELQLIPGALRSLLGRAAND